MSTAVLGLGANLGNPASALQGAIDALAAAPGIDVTKVSPCYRTAPIGGPDQPDFLNIIVLIDTELDPGALLEQTMQIEAKWHRERIERWGPRTLDIDVITFDNLLSDDVRLTLPHPRAHERGFVMVPWSDVDPNAQIPGHGAVTHLLRNVDQAGIERTEIVLTVP
jgi:2-amino-4-hydroxy-6-hydroxymethyldihydropteridine diphosphokinase